MSAPETSAPAAKRPQREGWGITGSTPLALLGKIVGLGLVLALTIAMAGPLIADERWGLLALLIGTCVVIFALYIQPFKIPPKYLLPGLLFLLAFQILPVVMTVTTAFTNFGDGHRGTQAQAVTAIEGDSVRRVPDSTNFVLTIATAPSGKLAFLLTDPATQTVQVGTEDGLEPAVNPELSSTGKVTALPGYTILNVGQANARQADIQAFFVPTPRGAIRSSGLSSAFEGEKTLSFDPACDCIRAPDGKTWTADPTQGYFVAEDGSRLPQGWQVNVGFDNFRKLFTDPVLSKAFFGMLVWNFAFAIISVLGTFAVGLLMAMALNHPGIKGLKIYRILIVLPYAMPSFAMLLVWREMFNQDFGLINTILGSNINWLGDPTLAKIAVLTIQFWLGYPYMFLIATGALQSIPADLTEAAAVDGASRFFAFRTVTLPLLLVSTAPMLIASFSFNFNNFNAIGLTTEGGPFPPDSPTAGATDILISYTYRLAFGTGGVQYGYAAAVSLVIFLIVATVSVIGFRRTAVLEEIN